MSDKTTDPKIAVRVIETIDTMCDNCGEDIPAGVAFAQLIDPDEDLCAGCALADGWTIPGTDLSTLIRERDALRARAVRAEQALKETRSALLEVQRAKTIRGVGAYATPSVKQIAHEALKATAREALAFTVERKP